MRGYRGFLREFARTGSLRALVLQVRTGIAHVARQWTGRNEVGNPLARFFESYGPDGIRPASAAERRLRLASEACLVCGLCSAACAEAGGRPLLDPRDAVIAAARLSLDLRRAGLEGLAASSCAACAACDPVCPQGIPIHLVQESLAARPGSEPPQGAPDSGAPAARDARGPGIG